MSKELEGIMSKESKAEKMQIDTTLGQLPQKEKGSLQPIECKTIHKGSRNITRTRPETYLVHKIIFKYILLQKEDNAFLLTKLNRVFWLAIG